MATIADIHNPWRDALVPASFRNARFYVEAASRENGRRIALHEFPKKEQPYAEDLGRQAKHFRVRAYCIAFPTDMGDNFRTPDYRVPRNLLLTALETIGPGTLQLPSLPAENVVVASYGLTEEERLGGYCIFDIQFIEFGIAPNLLTPSINTAYVLNNAADVVRAQANDAVNQQSLADINVPLNSMSNINVPL